jgi:SGNH hydrolase-like domain, acetyltransferase AlgX
MCLLLDVCLRFLPPDFVTYRAWEPLVTFASGPGGFAPNSVYRNAKSYGDLSNLGNQPRLRQYRAEVFTTDGRGYRNRREVVRPFAGVLLLGDSFVAGSGISDELTLGEQISRISGLRVYNGAMAQHHWDVIGQLQMTRGLVVWEQSERTPLPVLAQEGADPARVGDPTKLPSEDSLQTVRHARRYISASRIFSPLQILSGRAIKLLQNDRVLPNPYRTQVVTAMLRNGKEILFLPTEVENFDRERPTDPAFFVQLERQLKRRGLALLLLLVPDKYVVYRNLLRPAPLSTGRRPFLDVVEERLIAADVPVLNLTTRFRERAETLLARDEYIYWLDDTHWNAEGIRDAAEAIAQSTTVSQCPCR